MHQIFQWRQNFSDGNDPMSHLISANLDMRKPQRILGHKSVYDTRKLYGEVAEKNILREAASPFAHLEA
jgi:site-specific recombinase XerD